MKKISFLSGFAVLISFCSVHAQVTKGSLLLGGGINIYVAENESDDNSTSYKQDGFSFSPVIGIAIKDNLVFGGSLVYTYSKYRQGSTSIPNDQKSIGYGAGIFLRKYKPIGKAFYIFLEGSLAGKYDRSDNTPPSQYNNYKRTSFIVSATPGIAFTLSRKLQLETGFNQLLAITYSHEKGDKSPGYNLPYKANSFNFSSSLTNGLLSSVYFGFRVMLGK